MGEDLLAQYRARRTPPRQRCLYFENEDGSIRIANMYSADCLSDYSDLSFFVKPKNKPKMKTEWRKSDICADVPPS